MSQQSVPHEGVAKSLARRNRRATIRYRCAPATVGKVHPADDHEFQRAWIQDLSLKGVGMELSRPIEIGQLMLITIRAPDGKTVLELSARVVHCEPVPHSGWHVGGELTAPLTPEQLEQLL